MIETYKIMTGKYDIEIVGNIWNSLPSYVVSAETVNWFKTRLHRFWFNNLQDIIYNFRSEIHGTGSRSEITVKSSLE